MRILIMYRLERAGNTQHVNVLNEPEMSIIKSFHISHVTWLRLECRKGGCGDGDTLHTLQGWGWGWGWGFR
jgi:hypothetical protein